MSKKVAISIYNALRLIALLVLLELLSALHMLIFSEFTGVGLAWILISDIAETLLYIGFTGGFVPFFFIRQ